LKGTFQSGHEVLHLQPNVIKLNLGDEDNTAAAGANIVQPKEIKIPDIQEEPELLNYELPPTSLSISD